MKEIVGYAAVAAATVVGAAVVAAAEVFALFGYFCI